MTSTMKGDKMKQSELIEEIKSYYKKEPIFAYGMSVKILFDIAWIIYLLVK